MNQGDNGMASADTCKRVASAFVNGLIVATLLTILPLTAMGQSGEFRVSNYATGTNYNDFFWRGYAFEVSREVTVTGLIGGWGNAGTCFATQFSGALYTASDTGNTLTVSGEPPQPQFRMDALLASASFDRADSTAPGGPTPAEIEAGRVALTNPVTLVPGQLYILAQGSHNQGSNCHFASTLVDVDNLLQGSAIIADWYPAINRAYRFANSGTPESRVGVSADRLDEARVLVGFEYETDVLLPTVVTTSASPTGSGSARFTGNLADSGQTEAGQTLALYFEWADNPDFIGSELQLAAPSSVDGPATNVNFSLDVSGLEANVEYFVRAVAINEAGRRNANVLSFIVSQVPAIPVPVNNAWVLMLLALLMMAVAFTGLRRRAG